MHSRKGGSRPARPQVLYPHLMAGYDRDGRPVRVECMGRIRTKLLYELTTEEHLMRYHIYQNEEAARRFLPAANRRVGDGSNFREVTIQHHDTFSTTVQPPYILLNVSSSLPDHRGPRHGSRQAGRDEPPVAKPLTPHHVYSLRESLQKMCRIVLR